MSPTTVQIHLGRRADLAAHALQRFEIGTHRVVLVSVDGEFIALDDTCSHEDASLAEEGEIDSEARELECCRHGARFSLDDGSAISLPATSGLRVYPIAAEGEDIFIELPA